MNSHAVQLVFNDIGAAPYLHLYDVNGQESWHATGACGVNTVSWLGFQMDGNLVIYCADAALTSFTPIWSTNTWIRN